MFIKTIYNIRTICSKSREIQLYFWKCIYACKRKLQTEYQKGKITLADLLRQCS